MGVNLSVSVQYKPSYGRGRHPRRPEISPHKVKQEAARLLPLLSTMARRVIALLSVAGVLTSGQLVRTARVSRRTLQHYHQQYLLDRLPIQHTDSIAAMLKDSSCVIYTLGPVGLEIARVAHGHAPTGYAGFGTERIAHDIFVAETVLRLAEAAQRLGWEAIWHGKHEATVPDAYGRPALEPDALVILRKEEQIWPVALELHNEDKGTRAEDKIRRYETVYLEGRWRDVWETDRFPALLVVFTHRAVGRGYANVLRSARAPRFRILLKPFQDLLEGDPLDNWVDPVIRKSVSLFEIGEEE